MDFSVNAKMFGYPLYSDCQFPSFIIAHPGRIYIGVGWEDVRRFSLTKSEPSCQSWMPNMKIVSPSEFDAFPWRILRGDLGGFTFKPYQMSGTKCQSRNGGTCCQECMKSIRLWNTKFLPLWFLWESLNSEKTEIRDHTRDLTPCSLFRNLLVDPEPAAKAS